jgi:hypothetical protein
MNKLVSWTCVLAVAVLIAAACSRQSAAQGFNLNDLKKQINDAKNQSNQSNQDKDNDKNSSNNSNGQSNQSSKKSKSNKQSNDQDGNQIQQFFSNGQNSRFKFQNSNQQDNFQNNQQFQNWQQNNQNGFKIGSWNGGKWQGSRDVKQWTQAFGGNQQPFSSQWYKDHPKAWKDNNNKVNFWVGGSLPGVYSWLGWGNVPQQYRVYYGNTQQPQYDRSYYGEWYPLGVYSLMSSPGDVGTRIVQLAVNQQGRIGGNYYDMITSSNYSLSGDVRQQSQRATWWLNKNQFVRFRANLYELVQPYGSVTVQLPGGEQQWQFVRLED